MGGGFGSLLYTVGPCLFLSYGLLFFGLVLLWPAVDFFCGCDEHSILSNDAPLLLTEDLDETADESGVIVREASEDVRAAMSALLFETDNNPLLALVELLLVRGSASTKTALASLILHRNPRTSPGS